MPRRAVRRRAGCAEGQRGSLRRAWGARHRPAPLDAASGPARPRGGHPIDGDSGSTAAAPECPGPARRLPKRREHSVRRTSRSGLGIRGQAPGTEAATGFGDESPRGPRCWKTGSRQNGLVAGSRSALSALRSLAGAERTRGTVLFSHRTTESRTEETCLCPAGHKRDRSLVSPSLRRPDRSAREAPPRARARARARARTRSPPRLTSGSPPIRPHNRDRPVPAPTSGHGPCVWIPDTSRAPRDENIPSEPELNPFWSLGLRLLIRMQALADPHVLTEAEVSPRSARRRRSSGTTGDTAASRRLCLELGPVVLKTLDACSTRGIRISRSITGHAHRRPRRSWGVSG